MAELPVCPNVKEGVCHRSELRLSGENESAWFFTCATCFLFWQVTKPRIKDQARWQNKVDKVQKISDHERELSKRTKYFVMGKS